MSIVYSTNKNRTARRGSPDSWWYLVRTHHMIHERHVYFFFPFLEVSTCPRVPSGRQRSNTTNKIQILRGYSLLYYRHCSPARVALSPPPAITAAAAQQPAHNLNRQSVLIYQNQASWQLKPRGEQAPWQENLWSCTQGGATPFILTSRTALIFLSEASTLFQELKV